MRWPFVSRAVADARDAMLRELLAGSKADYLAACARYDALLERHEAFVALVAERTAPNPKPVPQVKREPDAADTAIEWLARGDMAKRRDLERFARNQRRAGKDPDAIAAEIMGASRRTDDDKDEGVPG